VRTLVLSAIASLALACGGSPRPSSGAGGTEVSKALAEARALLARGEADAALARLATEPEDADVLYLRGRSFLARSATAPPPAATPVPEGAPRGAVPVAPEYKPDEIEALGCFERAIALRPDHSPSHLAIGELLAPHAARRVGQVGADAGRSKRARDLPSESTATSGPDASPERVARAFRNAVQSDPGSKAAIEGLIRFGTLLNRPDDTEFGLSSLIALEKESAEPRVRYGDFLLAARKDPDGAIGRYREALIWRPGDPVIMAKVADVFIAQGAEAYGARQYSVANARFKEAQKYVPDSSSAQSARLGEYMARLREIRGTSLR
jgi:tetratricopeptide (TPR) repeat protein